MNFSSLKAIKKIMVIFLANKNFFEDNLEFKIKFLK